MGNVSLPLAMGRALPAAVTVNVAVVSMLVGIRPL
jgi:hypothetical protein